MKYFFFVLCTAAQPMIGQSRSADTLQTRSSEIEDLLENVVGEEAGSQEADILGYLAEFPVNLNSATRADLESIPGISPMLASAIIARRNIIRFTSIREVLGIAGISMDEFETIRRYTVVEEKPSSFAFSRVRMRTRIQSDGYQPDLSSPMGPPIKSYNRVVLEMKEDKDEGLRVEGGLVTEKDPGERYSDIFAAGYLSLEIPSLDGSLLIGDFFIESGKGLVFWRSAGITKGGDITGLGKPHESRIVPYRSTDENGFFRGMALRKTAGRFSIMGFVSRRWLNGSKNEEGVLTSLDSDGLFRTESELKTRGVIRETVLGGMLFANLAEGFEAGLKVSRDLLNGPLALSRFEAFTDRNAEMVAMDLIWRRAVFAASGEVARDRKGSIAAVAGIYLKPGTQFTLTLQVRAFPRSFNSLHGSPLSDGGRVEGERGVYLGVTARLFSQCYLSAMYDAYESFNRFLFPKVGQDFLTRVNVRVDRRWEVTLHMRRQSKPSLIDSDGELPHQSIGSVMNSRYRLSVAYTPSDKIRWQTRIEMCSLYLARGGSEKGMLVFQDLRWQCHPNLRLSARIATFATDTYETRLSMYEQDVPGAFSNLFLWGDGLRTYVLAEISVLQGWAVSIKYSRLFRQSEVPGRDQEAAKDRFTFQCDVSM